MQLTFANVDDAEELIRNAYLTQVPWLLKDSFTLDDFPADYVGGAMQYADKIEKIVRKVRPDIIHSHDWMTFPAGMVAKNLTGSPLVAHIHSTEVDRTGGHYPNPYVFSIEKAGMQVADRVISVSEFTKSMLVNNYGIVSDKIDVVHNGVEFMPTSHLSPALTAIKKLGFKVVLYLGRITLQKGPEYFIRAASVVLRHEPKTIFVVVGSGDMQEAMMAEAGRLGILDKVLFTGFLRGAEKESIWRAADLYVMPSVSEPFGITPLESIANGTPVLISKQSGISEVLEHALKVDFWDIEEMANKIISYLRFSALKRDLQRESGKELIKLNWDSAADKCIDLYQQLTSY